MLTGGKQKKIRTAAAAVKHKATLLYGYVVKQHKIN